MVEWTVRAGTLHSIGLKPPHDQSEEKGLDQIRDVIVNPRGKKNEKKHGTTPLAQGGGTAMAGGKRGEGYKIWPIN